MLRASLVVAVTALLSGGPKSAAAIDVPIAGQVAAIKAGKLAKFVSKNPAGVALPAPGSSEDPTLNGADLRFFDEGGDGGDLSFTLDASGWKGLGNPAGSQGYKYKGRDDALDTDPKGTCKIVLLKEKVVKAVCKGPAVTLTTPFAGDAWATLALPAGSTAARYCAEFGGDEKKNDTTSLKRTGAPAPPSCPALPPEEPEFLGIDPDDLAYLTDDSLAGRNNNTPGSILAQNYLISQLQPIADGLNSSETGDDAYKQPFTLGTNILAVIPGGDLASEYVMIGAHYDHVGSCTSLEVGDTVCNGATDNAAGVVAVLAIARSIANLPSPPRRSVILAFWDREEDGLLGSEFYVDNPLVPLASTIAYVNFDIQGANLLPSLRDVSFAIASETGGALLQSAVDDAIDGLGLGTRKLSSVFGQARSDYANTIGVNIPTVFFSDATGPCYHTNQDELGVVDLGKLEIQSHIAFRLTLSLTDTATPPTFVTPSGPLANFADALVLNDVINAGVADLGLFTPADQSTLLDYQSDLNAIVAAGPGSFDSGDVATLLFGAIDTLEVLSHIACDGFLAP